MSGMQTDTEPRDSTCPHPGMFSLYRFHDAHEQLLYVGISNEPWRRRKEHSVTQSWYPQVRHQSITWYDSEARARAAEDLAIKQERPHRNIAGAIRPPRARFRLRLDIAVAIGTAWGLLPMALLCVMVTMRATPFLREVLVPVVIFACITWPIVVIIVTLVVAAPLIARLGNWLERNTVDGRPEVAR